MHKQSQVLTQLFPANVSIDADSKVSRLFISAISVKFCPPLSLTSAIRVLFDDASGCTILGKQEREG